MKYLIDIGTEIVDISNQFPENYKKPTDECNHEEYDHYNEHKIVCSKCNPELWKLSSKETKAYSTYIISKKLQNAKDRYYSDGKSPLSDDEYDSLESSLRAINPNAPILNKVGYDIDSEE